MKNLFILKLCFILTNVAFSEIRKCPSETKNILECKSKALLPLIPFVSICHNDQEELVILDQGSTQAPVTYDAIKTDDENSTSWTMVDENSGEELTFTYLKIEKTQKFNGILKYELFGNEVRSKYNCKSSSF